MEAARIAIIDPAAGISGDMLLGALIDAGASEEWLAAIPGRLGIADQVTISVTRVMRCGVRCAKVDVHLADGSTEGPSEVVDRPAPGGHDHHHDHHGHHDHHPHEHHHHAHGGDAPHHHAHSGGDHPHRHVPELMRLVEAGQFSPAVKERAQRALRLLAEAEGKVHGMAWDEVHLHEVGAMDALVDIVGGIDGFEQLGVRRIHARPVAVGNGWVRAAHGVMAVPAPATMELLAGVEIGPAGPVSGEATTPTGAVLLRVLAAGGPPQRWRALRTGWGAGGRDPAGYPNALRLVVAESVAEAGEVVVLSTDVDDLSPEYLEPLREALTAAGALDVQTWSTQMKKGRIGFRIEAVVGAGEAGQVTEALFRHSSTAGIRRIPAERITLQRRELRVPGTDHAPVRVKVLEGPGGSRVKPEYEDVHAAARQSGRPAHEVAREVAERARAAINRAAEGGPITDQEQG